MNKLLLLTLLLAAGPPGLAQQDTSISDKRPDGKWAFEFGAGYAQLRPKGPFPDFGNFGGANLYAGIRVMKNRLLLGLEFGTAAQRPAYQTHNWITGSGPVESKVFYESDVSNAGLHLRYYLSNRTGLNYFLMAGGGRMQANGFIELRDITGDACEPLLDGKRILRSAAPYGALGAGLSFNSQWLPFWSDRPTGHIKFKLEITAQYLASGNITMYNVRNPDNELPTGAEPVLLDFLDTQTGRIHSHSAGYRLRAPLRALLPGISFSFAFNTTPAAEKRKWRQQQRLTGKPGFQLSQLH